MFPQTDFCGVQNCCWGLWKWNRIRKKLRSVESIDEFRGGKLSFNNIYVYEPFFETCCNNSCLCHRREQNFLIINNFNFQIFPLCKKISKVQEMCENTIHNCKSYSFISANQVYLAAGCKTVNFINPTLYCTRRHTFEKKSLKFKNKRESKHDFWLVPSKEIQLLIKNLRFREQFAIKKQRWQW